MRAVVRSDVAVAEPAGMARRAEETHGPDA